MNPHIDIRRLLSLDLGFEMLIESTTAPTYTVNGGTGVVTVASLGSNEYKITAPNTVTSIAPSINKTDIIKAFGVNIGGITTLQGLFSGCISLVEADLSAFDMSGITGINSMFLNCSSLTLVNFGISPMDNITTTSYMFNGCSIIEKINLDNIGAMSSTSNHMFNGCTNLTCISKLDTTNSLNKDNMFSGTPALLHPNALEQSDLTDVNGANWVNGNPCP